MKKKKISLPLLVRIVIAIALGVGLGFVLPAEVIRVFNTFNGLFDQLLKFLIPLIILALVTAAIADVGRGAGKMLAVTAGMAYVATVLSGLFSYLCSVNIFPFLIDGEAAVSGKATEAMFPAYFNIDIPPVMPVMTALVASFLIGIGIAIFGGDVLKKGFTELKDIVSHAISKIIIPFLPVYIFGMFLNMTAEGEIGAVLSSFIQIIIVIFLMSVVLLLLQYAVAGIVTKRNPFKLLVKMLPAYFAALGTSSSAATIPVTLRQTLDNGVRQEIAGFTIPLCATIHLSGSTLKIVACAIAIMFMQNIPFDFSTLLGFIFMLGITMVAAPGVPGGAIMAALGVLDSILGFSAEQQAMMITLYIAMDSFGTACNVTGDGAIALIVDKIWTNLHRPSRN